jgi:hypothetical protein
MSDLQVLRLSLRWMRRIVSAYLTNDTKISNKIGKIGSNKY